VTAQPIAKRALTAAMHWRLRGRPWSWIANVVAAVAAGALSLDDVRQAVADAWELWHPDEREHFELMAWEHHLVDHVVPSQGRMLIVGSGAGRDLVGFARLGFRVTGIEPAPLAAQASVDALRARDLEGRVLHGFAEDVAIDGVFETVIFSYFCYGYIPGSARRISLLEKLRANLAPSGTIVLTYNPRPGASLTRLTQFSAWLAGSEWRPEAGDAVYLMASADAPFAVEHHFHDAEIADEARRAGYDCAIRGNIGEVRMALLTARR